MPRAQRVLRACSPMLAQFIDEHCQIFVEGVGPDTLEVEIFESWLESLHLHEILAEPFDKVLNETTGEQSEELCTSEGRRAFLHSLASGEKNSKQKSTLSGIK